MLTNDSIPINLTKVSFQRKGYNSSHLTSGPSGFQRDMSDVAQAHLTRELG